MYRPQCHQYRCIRCPSGRTVYAPLLQRRQWSTVRWTNSQHQCHTAGKPAPTGQQHHSARRQQSNPLCNSDRTVHLPLKLCNDTVDRRDRTNAGHWQGRVTMVSQALVVLPDSATVCYQPAYHCYSGPYFLPKRKFMKSESGNRIRFLL